MKRKQAKQALASVGVFNRFTLKTVGFLGRDTRQVLTIKDWTSDPKADAIEEAFRPHKIIVEFDR